MRERKPMLTVDKQIEHLKSKGVKFDLCSEDAASSYLEHTNNYLRAAAYRKLYSRRTDGDRPGTYVNLDFEDLVELSSIDRRLREALLAAAIDVEHFAKVRLLQRCGEHTEDGYSIVVDYLGSISPRQCSRIEGAFDARSGDGRTHDEYSGDLIAHYADTYPVWVFLEVVEFGVLADMWRYCAGRWGEQVMRDEHYVLKSVKALRNACAHNSLIVNGFTSAAANADYQVSRSIAISLIRNGMPKTKSRQAKLKNLRMAQIAATLYSVNEFCELDTTRARHARRMADVRSYAVSCGVLSRANDGIVSFFDFVWKMVDIWLPIG
jgi:abortive infection bacteriophage resistance protein